MIQLPKGGGAIRGIGEKFAANPVTGTGSLTVPIYTSPGRSGFGPQLSLSYDSGAGNGPFGFGWRLSIPAISRKTDKGLPRYWDAEESDEFLLSDAEDLVPVLRYEEEEWVREQAEPRTRDGNRYKIQRYRPRIEGLFARIERWTNESDPGDVFWRSISKDNITTWYGRTEKSRIADPADPSRIFSWLICESYDDKGNLIAYEYLEENAEGVKVEQAHERNRGVRPDGTRPRSANRYLKRIKYGYEEPYFPVLEKPETLTHPSEWFFEVVFDYEDHDPENPTRGEQRPWKCRADPFSSYRSGFEIRTYRLCQRVLMFHRFDELGGDCLVRSTDFQYVYEKQDLTQVKKPLFSFLASVTQTGYKAGVEPKSLPPLEFEYTQPEVQDKLHEVDLESLENLPQGLDGVRYQWVDLEGEGLSGILTEQATGWYFKHNLSPVNRTKEGNAEQRLKPLFGPLEVVTQKPSMAALSSGHQQMLDLAGDGQLDLVELDRPTPGFYERTPDEKWENFKPFASLPNLDWSNPNLKFVDLTGDGHADVVISEEEAFTWYPSLAEEGFGPGERVRQALDEEQGVRLVFADGTQSIYLVDFSGDGLTDVARIRNGEVCYWPNLGYGRFGPKITMDNAPWFDAPDQFDQKRIRLADIDGTGTTDIIYLHSDGVRLYFNLSGNSWSAATPLAAFPRVDNLASVMVVDLLGNGTACLVWSSPLPGDAGRPMRYVDLMGGQKPHLLTRTVNNLGAETTIHYAPSTRFYLQDKQAGHPWITRIPFPVHVVERVETCDHISRNRFVTRYEYHHGYFDGVEREFRGFGRVDQWDTEQFETFAESVACPDATNVDQASHVPAVHTRTWFHTGAFLEEGAVSEQFKQEYWSESREISELSPEQLESMLLRDSVLPTKIRISQGQFQDHTLTTEEAREACRALKGSILRQEVYAEDNPDLMERPYTVSERNYEIEHLQPQTAGNQHAVFFVRPRKTVDFHYERKLYELKEGPRLFDPRVTQNITLAVDDYGNVLQSVAIAYGRRLSDADLAKLFAEEGLGSIIAKADRDKQRRTLITYTENRYTNPVDHPDGPIPLIPEPDAYRVPMPSESCTFELIKRPNPAEESTRLVTELIPLHAMEAIIAQASDGNHDLDYEDIEAGGIADEAWWRRPIEHVRTLYRRDDLTGLLPLRELQSLALPGETYRLAFTPGLIESVYQRNRDGTAEPLLTLAEAKAILGSKGPDGGGYVDLDGDGHWWIPSGQVFYSHDPGDPVGERAEARQDFFLPKLFRDPFENDTTVTYEEHKLMVLKTKDPLDNVMAAGEWDEENNFAARIDYRVLQPSCVTDPNRNRSKVAFDALGMVVATAVMGKSDAAEGDRIGDDYRSDLGDGEIDAFFDGDPHSKADELLGPATTRIIYDLNRYREKGEPVLAATLARETHLSDLDEAQQTRIQISFSYSDGFGREIQKKIQAEPKKTNGIAGPLRWVGSGWTIFNNKGKPVRQYEPFFSQLEERPHRFEFGREEGVSPVLFYDPVERVVATLHPNQTFEKVGFDPWRQRTWDVNDTVLLDPRTDPDTCGLVKGYFEHEPAEWSTWYQQRINDPQRPAEQSAAEKTAVHADTPTIAFFDALGRPFLTVAHNRFLNADGDLVDEYYPTRTEFDIEGNQRTVVDALDRIVMRYDYSIAGPAEGEENASANRIHQASMDAGERWMLNNAAGNPIRAWDSRGFTRTMAYDQLQRLNHHYVSGNGLIKVLAEKTVYGEDRDEGLADPEQTNHRRRIYKAYDGAGIVTHEAYDFKGNLLRTNRQLLRNYREQIDWNNQEQQTEGETFTSQSCYDALNRVIGIITPDKSDTRYSFNEANLLDAVRVNLHGTCDDDGKPVWTSFVTNIDYNAKGQRLCIEYGCGAGSDGKGVKTTYTYDEKTFRLLTLTTTRPGGGNHLASQIFRDNTVVQALGYTYDPTGNITQIHDTSLQIIEGRVKPVWEYRYDAIYRLIEASGREHKGQTAFLLEFNRDYPFTGASQPNDLKALQHYTERYEYDAVGNFQFMHHQANNSGWTRAYEYGQESPLEPGSGKNTNRLTSTTIGNGHHFVETYTYKDEAGNDVHGCMTAINDMGMTWDFEDQLQQVHLGGGGSAYYVYDAAGQRVRRVVHSQNGTRQKERLYLGGYEIYREYNGNEQPKLERESLHVMDDQQRIALVESQTIKESELINSPAPLHRYQFGNHLGSASVELREDGGLISYEEYHSYGTTAFQGHDSGVSLKRYRYTGKERDEETGLNHHGARYYAAWLGRWVSCDPVGLIDGTSPYVYVASRPTHLVDSRGMQSERTEELAVARPNAQLLRESGVKFAEQVTVKTTNSAGATVTLRADKLVRVSGEYYYIEEKLPEKVLTIKGNLRRRAFTKNQLKRGGLKAVFEGSEIEIRGGRNLGDIGLKVGSRVKAGLHVITERELAVVNNLNSLLNMVRRALPDLPPKSAAASTPIPSLGGATPSPEPAARASTLTGTVPAAEEASLARPLVGPRLGFFGRLGRLFRSGGTVLSLAGIVISVPGLVREIRIRESMNDLVRRNPDKRVLYDPDTQTITTEPAIY